MIRQKVKYFTNQTLNMEDGPARKNVAFSVMLPTQERRRRHVRKRSFTEALKEKYCMSDPNKIYTSNCVIDIVVTGKPRNNGSDAELAYLRNVVLTNSAVEYAGLPNDGLKSLCPNVMDLDLSNNMLTNWTDILTIMSHLPCLKFVNLAGNKIENKEQILQNWDKELPQVENLVLNRTDASWEEVLLLTKRLPSLKELHICENGYDVLHDDWDPHQHFGNIQCLRMNNNNIQRWEEIWRFKYLPKLESLILSGNPIEDIFYHQDDHSTSNRCHDFNCQPHSEMEMDENRNSLTPSDLQEIVVDLVSSAFRKIEFMEIGSFEENSYLSENDNHQYSRGDNSSPLDASLDDSESSSSLNMSLDNSHTESESQKDSQSHCQCEIKQEITNKMKPFANLALLCVSDTMINHWNHMTAVCKYPSLTSLRIKNVPLASELEQDERRKLLIASLPHIKALNGSEVSFTERDKSERHYIRYFTEANVKPDRFHELEAKHGKIEPIVDIDLGARYQEWVNVTFIYKDFKVKDKVHVVEPVGKLRLIAAEKFCLYASLKTLKLYHFACGPYRCENEQTFEELIVQTQSLPMSRFDIMEGDELYVDPYDGFTNGEGTMPYLIIFSYMGLPSDIERK